jgi:hypothetical protein
LISAERHRRDVDAMVAQQRPDAADHSRPVGVFEDEDYPVRARFDWAAIYADNAWRGSKKCAADGNGFAFSCGRKFE